MIAALRWDRAAVAHVYRRAGFGAGARRVDAATRGGLDSALGDLFGRMEQSEARLGTVRPLLARGQVEDLQAWWMSLILADEAPLLERIVLMWHNHFATSFDKVEDVRMMHRQNALFRELGAGDFRVLLHAVAKDPAMLVWLDGNDNRRGAPNENFGREVLELFALGIGNYTERDVKEAARAFTGWGTRGRSFLYREQHHDPGPKRLFGVERELTGEEAVDLILAQPACARHVARRLLREFVQPDPAERDVEEVAGFLREEDWHVARTLERLFRSETFLSPANYRSRIASPVELVAVTATSLDARIAPRLAAESAAHMGQALFRPPTVKGWDGGRTWINAGTWLARHNLMRRLATSPGEGIEVDLNAAFGVEDDASRDVAQRVLDHLLPDLSDTRFRETLAAAARQCTDPDQALSEVTALVLTAPEYHRA